MMLYAAGSSLEAPCRQRDAPRGEEASGPAGGLRFQGSGLMVQVWDGVRDRQAWLSGLERRD